MRNEEWKGMLVQEREGRREKGWKYGMVKEKRKGEKNCVTNGRGRKRRKK